MHRILRALAAAILVSVLGQGAALAGPKKVVATFSILADMAQQIGGDKIVVEVLVKAKQDAHDFSPKPSDMKALIAADVILANGLGFEPWLSKAVATSRSKAHLANVSEGIVVRRSRDQRIDPHAWQNVANAKVYARNITGALTILDPTNGAYYEASQNRYLAALDALEINIRTQLKAIPRDRRIIVTNHDAFGYFGDAYGVTFLAPIGLSTEQEPSARDVAKLIDQIKAQRVTAVFVESFDDPRLIQQIAAETNANVGPAVYSDALSEQAGPAASYIEMMTHNVTAFAAAIK